MDGAAMRKMTSYSQSMHEENKANLAALDQRVLGLENDVQGLRADLSTGLSQLRTDFVQSFNAITVKLDGRSDIKWMAAPVIAFMMFLLALVGGLGTMAILPVKDDLIRVREEMRASVAAKEKALDAAALRDQRIWDHVSKMRSDFDYLRGQLAKP